jgi:hypothetical protein
MSVIRSTSSTVVYLDASGRRNNKNTFIVINPNWLVQSVSKYIFHDVQHSLYYRQFYSLIIYVLECLYTDIFENTCVY